MLKNTLIKLIAFAVLILFISACGDNGTEATEGEAPSLPNLEYSQPDISYFENTQVQGKSNSNNYLAARNTVLGFSNLGNIGIIYGNILATAPQGEVTFNDGLWEWSYGYSFQGVSSEMRITASENGNSTSWAVYWSFNDGTDMGFEDYKLMEGTTENDGLTGNWTFNSLEPESSTPIPFVTSSWVTDGEEESDITLELLDSTDSSDNITITYDKSGSEFLMLIELEEPGSENIEIGWNTETNLGYFQEGDSDPLCWDSSSGIAVDSSCS